MEEIRQRLVNQRQSLLGALADGQGSVEEADRTRSGRLTRLDDLHSQAMSQEAARRRRQELARVDAALRRLAEGEYGYCTACGESIAAGRLAVDPSAEHCIRCATRAEETAR